MKTEIPVSKSKTFFLFVLALFMIACSIFISVTKEDFKGIPSKYLNYFGIFAALFFGLCTIFILKQLFSKQAGLIITPQAIEINAGIKSKVLWEDIKEIGKYQVMSTKMIILHLHDDEKYLNELSGFSKIAAKGNISTCGAPIGFSTNTLKTDFNDLYVLLNDKLNEYSKHVI